MHTDPSICGDLQVMIAGIPADTESIVVKIYRGAERTGTLVEERKVVPAGSEEMNLLFQDLLAEDHFVGADGLDGDGLVIYSGNKDVTVSPEKTTSMDLCLTSRCGGGIPDNRAPRIEAVDAFVLLSPYVDAGVGGVFPPEGET